MGRECAGGDSSHLPSPVPLLSAVKEFVDRIVEVEKIKVVGVSEEEVRLIQERAEAERAELVARAAAEQVGKLRCSGGADIGEDV